MTQSGPKGTLTQEEKPKRSKYQENFGITKSSEFFHELSTIENNLLDVFNKLNDTQYISGIITLSNYILTNCKISVLSKGLGFLPHSRGTRHWQYYSGSGHFKREARLQLFFSESNQDPQRNDTQSGGPFEHRSFKLKSSFNLIGPFQSESMFCSIEQDSHRQKYRA